MMVLKTKVSGKEIEALAEVVSGTLWIHYQGRTLAIETNQKKKKKRWNAAGGSGGGDLVAPMPGKITKILKEIGDLVLKGDAIVVMEAMKMEYTLKAGADGQLTQLSCQIGEQVSLGQTLAIFESKAGV